jgi:hypothetical protein
MKRLNETQKKWALTASLATVLSFNLIMGLTGTNYGSANFASAKIDEEAGEVMIEGELAEPRFVPFNTEDGKLKIKYEKLEDGTTKAYVPKKTAEGDFCWSSKKCGSKNYVLPTSFDASKDDLEQALRKAMKQEAKAELLAKDDSDSDDVEEVVQKKAKKLKKELRKQREDDEEDADYEDKDLAKLQEKCVEEDEDYKLSCYSDGLKSLLSNKKKTLPKDEVLSLYMDEVEPLMIESLSDSRNSERREEAHKHLEGMLSDVLKKYNYLRERMVDLSALTVIQNEQEAQAAFKKGDTAKGLKRRAVAERIAFDLKSTLKSGLESAQFSAYINESRADELYTNNYADVVGPIIQGMQAAPLAYVISSPLLEGSTYVVDRTGNLVPVDPSQSPISSVRNIGRGVSALNNGLTQVNVLSPNAPRIVTLNGMNNAQGTATLQLIPASQVPQAQYAPVVAPGTNVIGIRGR